MKQDFNTLSVEERRRLAEKYRSMGILDKWHGKSLNDFTNDPRALSIVERYLEDVETPLKQGIAPYFFGANGVGKTLLMTTLFMELFDRGYSVKIISISSLITKFTQGWYSKEERLGLMTSLQRTQFLGIEEFGKVSTGATDLHTSVLENVIRFRLQMSRPTFITSNVLPKEISSIYNEDIASMLRECCFDVQVRGEDYRKKIADNINKKYK